MLYALYLGETAELDDIKETTDAAADGMDSSFFQFTVERMRHYQGAWHSIRTTVFPNYLFIECDEDAARRLQEEQLSLIALSDEVCDFLTGLFGAQHHLAMSKGVVKGGVAHVTEGPLMGYESRIVKVDRHKRLAWLKIAEGSGFDLGKESTSTVIAGLEILEKE